MKKILLSFLVFNLSVINLYSQTNCSLIDRITIHADTTSVVNQKATMFYLDTNAYMDTVGWQYVVIIKAADLTGKIYINGELKGVGQFANVTYSYTQLYLAASYYTSWGGFYNGWLDEFRVSNTIRTDSEILNHYNSGLPFNTDANTLGLWHFNETSGTTFANEIGGSGDLFNGVTFDVGKFGNSVYFDGIDDRGNCNLNIPENNITFEFWIKIDGSQSATVIQPYGYNSSNIYIAKSVESPTYEWSNGYIGDSITINPNVDSLIWVTDGNCTDTLNFYRNTSTIFDTTFVTVHDTVVTTVNDTTYITITDSISVTDTLIIDVTITGLTPPNNTNTIRVYPNPTSQFIYIDNGNYTNMTGYSMKIVNSTGQDVFNSIINQQLFSIDVNDFGSTGTYFIQIIDQNSNIIDTRKIILN